MIKKRILITGAAGFLGSHFVEEILTNTDWEIVAFCRTAIIGDMSRIYDSQHVKDNFDRVKVVYHDLRFEIPEHTTEKIGKLDYIAHIAANSHVDRSITHPKQFFEDNVIGTINLLEWYRKYHKTALFINYLTDEVFGPAPEDYDFKERDPWNPSNPYSASKAGQGAAGIAYHNTYKLPIISTYTMNLFGERQDKEKFVAKCIKNIKNGNTTRIHAKLDGAGNVDYVGSRHWLHARNAANATLFLILNGKPGEHYNVVGDIELNNDDLLKRIGSIMNKEPLMEYVDFSTSRPGHDKRYALDGSKLKEMGWKQPLDFDTSLSKTVDWIVNNE